MIIKSILDTDLYKFSTSYAYMKMFPNAVGTFTFFDRDNTEYNDDFIVRLNMEIAALSSVTLTDEEFNFMSKKCPYIPFAYWEWLKGFKFDASKIHITLDDDKHLHIFVTDLLYKATLWEVPILAIISELRSRVMFNYTADNNYIINNTEKKIKIANENGIKFSEFGTRRRFSQAVQELVISLLKEKSTTCVGTSNCLFAMKYDMTPIGTHPHEWFMFHGAMFGYIHANYMAMENWVNVYDADLGIALTDTFTSSVFFKNFSKKHAKLFDGIRQDSGDEYRFTMDAIARYKELGVDPTTKTIVFSNALDFDRAKDINEYCRSRIRASFGIGTNLTNDTNNKPSNIVMKLTSCSMNEKQPTIECIKISDDLGKHTGSKEAFENCMNQIKLLD